MTEEHPRTHHRVVVIETGRDCKEVRGMIFPHFVQAETVLDWLVSNKIRATLLTVAEYLEMPRYYDLEHEEAAAKTSQKLSPTPD